MVCGGVKLDPLCYFWTDFIRKCNTCETPIKLLRHLLDVFISAEINIFDTGIITEHRSNVPYIYTVAKQYQKDILTLMDCTRKVWKNQNWEIAVLENVFSDYTSKVTLL